MLPPSYASRSDECRVYNDTHRRELRAERLSGAALISKRRPILHAGVEACHRIVAQLGKSHMSA